MWRAGPHVAEEQQRPLPLLALLAGLDHNKCIIIIALSILLLMIIIRVTITLLGMMIMIMIMITVIIVIHVCSFYFNLTMTSMHTII